MCEMQTTGVDSAIPFLRGAPGGGKTESVRNLAVENDYEFLSCHFALKQPEDIGGIPQFSSVEYNGETILSTKWSIPEILSELLVLSNIAKIKDDGGIIIRDKRSNRVITTTFDATKTDLIETVKSNYSEYDSSFFEQEIYQKSDKKHIVLFFLDDIHRCSPFHVTALFELLSERKLREIHLPSNVAIILAGNSSIKAGAQLTNSAIINRCCVFDVKTDFDFWKDNFALQNNFNMHVLSFLMNSSYTKYFHEEESVDNPWASPRSWTKLSNVINKFSENKIKLSSDDLRYICTSHVGKDAADDFVTYHQMILKFKVDSIFKSILSDMKNSKPIQEIINLVISKINEKSEPQQFALAYASIIEYFKNISSERIKNGSITALSVFLLAFQANPQNTFPEITISVLKQIQAVLSSQNLQKEFGMISDQFNQLAKELHLKTIPEMLTDFINGTNEDE